jgi:hypothetical protein
VWLRDVTAALLGSGRRPFLEALSMCMSSPNHDLAAACLTTAAWLSRSLASIDAADVQLAAFSALIPRLKQRLAGDRSQAQHRVLASVTLYNFSKIPGNDAKKLSRTGTAWSIIRLRRERSQY